MQRRPFTTSRGTSNIPIEASATRHTLGNVLHMFYSERAWCWREKETGKGREVHTRSHWDDTDPIYWQVCKYKMVCWYIIYGIKIHEDTHWWIHDHGKRRVLHPIKKLEIKKYLNWSQTCQGQRCSEKSYLDPILPKGEVIRDIWQRHLSI